MNICKLRLLLLSVTLQGLVCLAEDWPQLHGPERNGIYSGTKLANIWPKEGPKMLWQRKVGQGFSGPVVTAGKLILFHRLGNEEVLEAFDAKTGTPIWKAGYATSYRDDFGFDEGPRATPTVAGNKIYTFGAEGALHCFSLSDGKEVWNLSAKDQFASEKGFFGMACSPLVEGNHVLMNIGGSNGAGIVAIDKETGKLIWKATDDEASYSSPVAATLGGKKRAVFFTRTGLVVLDPADGSIDYEQPWRARMHASVNAATPLVIGDLIFLSSSYDTGALLLRWQGSKAEKVWSSDEALSNHYATSVHHDGYLYGFHGRQEEGPHLRCIELKTGKVQWDEKRYPAGTVTLADGKLLILLEDGRLVLADASPKAFKVQGEAQILSFGVRAYPAIADGLFYARSKDKLVCVDLRP